MSERTVADTIAQQIGGYNRVKAMIGVTSFVYSDDSLSFRFKAKGLKKINAVYIRLTPMDVYDVEFIKCQKFERIVVEKLEGIYCDQLKEIIEAKTGLRLSL
jgi:hypothetical protein